MTTLARTRFSTIGRLHPAIRRYSSQGSKYPLNKGPVRTETGKSSVTERGMFTLIVVGLGLGGSFAWLMNHQRIASNLAQSYPPTIPENRFQDKENNVLLKRKA